MVNVGIIGGGVVGAAIAHRLSTHPNLAVQVFEQNPPHHLEATGAALGVLSAVISSKLKGKHLKLGLESLRLYEALMTHAQATRISPITCEFDIEPPNAASQRLHQAFGFTEVGSQYLAHAGKRVSMQALLQR